MTVTISNELISLHRRREWQISGHDCFGDRNSCRGQNGIEIDYSFPLRNLVLETRASDEHTALHRRHQCYKPHLATASKQKETSIANS